MESKSQSRLAHLNSQLQANPTFNLGKVPTKSDDDVVIVGMARTAMTKAKRGAQKDTPPESMLVPVLQAVVKQAGIQHNQVEDICIGNVLQPGAGPNTSRMAVFLAGFPETTTL